MKLRIEAGGWEAMAARLSEMAAALAPAAAEGLAQGLSGMAEVARGLVPVQSGRLRGSIGVEALAGAAGASGSLRAATPYAAIVELGGGPGRSARPFLYPAAQAGMEGLCAAVAEAVLRAVQA